MDATMLTSLLTTLPFAVEKSRLICPTSIQRKEGVDVALQCRLDPPANLVDYTLDVTRADLDEIVHSYRHGKDDSGPQVDQYRGRTTLTHGDLIRGIITLQISSVQLNDSGPYTCFVLGLKAGCTTNLTVVKEDQHNETIIDDPLTTIKSPTPDFPSDAEKVNVGAIVGVVVGGVVLAALIIGVLVKRETIRRCVQRLRGRRERDPEMAANRNEMI
ncbi:myelin-oligodendrocyte glycoprotein-like [Trachinotus anak]|uniref:myelin-oligodendrocyte glycoprotein-like n=1 Tax=Trachinotus anak TaxID=443729 RepID=UPI0039F17501